MPHPEQLSRIPASTYRLQLHREFSVADVIGLLDYLYMLGVDCVYVSPILKARTGSQHGYDVVDPDVLNPEIGTAEQFSELGRALRDRGMGMIVDIVPNHVSISVPENWRWMDVLENGPSSPYARFFDIDWHPLRDNLSNKILIPMLGDQYGKVLEDGGLRLQYADDVFQLKYGDKTFPIAPQTWPVILQPAAGQLRARLGEDSPFVMELESIITAATHLPGPAETDEARIRERAREKEVLKSRITALVSLSADFQSLLGERIESMNGRRDDPLSFNDLEDLLSAQAYRLSDWRVAADEINYRRFFDVDELASIRVEDPVVFAAVHAQILDGIREGWIQGLRVDHPDGLYDPMAYFHALQDAAQAAATQDTGEDSPAVPFYVVAEKILGNDERPRTDWAIHGTTGYRFLNEVNALFVDIEAKDALNGVYERFTRHLLPFSDLVYECKRLILRMSFSSELNVLSRRLDGIFQQHRHTRDFTLQLVHFGLTEVLACFPVYRTYVTETQLEVEAEDRRQIQLAVADARRRNPATAGSIFDAIASVLLLEDPPRLSNEQRAERRQFVMRFQQLTAPVMAKGVEDTAFYRQFPLASLNEVGGDPQTFGMDVAAFHKSAIQRSKGWAHGLLATSTHDTKRSEDVRARLNVLSEIPPEWAAAVQRWAASNELHRTLVDGSLTPDRAAEYLLYQTLVGIWPLQGIGDSAARSTFVQRIQQYMEKALHEAKLRTSWINPNAAYEDAVRTFVETILRPGDGNEFLPDIEAFCESIRTAGLWNGLSQILLKMTSPGVPDIYQGTELWNFTLVDPDNRQPVDYRKRQEMLGQLPLQHNEDRAEWIAEAAENLVDGRLKLFVTSVAAGLRRANATFFREADYTPLKAEGDHAGHVIAFARSLGGATCVTACARFFIKLGCRERRPAGDSLWGRSTLLLPTHSSRKYRDVFTGHLCEARSDTEQSFLSLGDLFSTMPVALLMSE